MGLRAAPAALLAAALTAAPAGWAQEVPPVAGVAVPALPPAALPAAEAAWARDLAELYGSSTALVASLRALGLDHVEVECAVAVSTRANRPVAEVLDLRKAGMPWADVARSFGFSLLEALRETPAAGRRRSAPPARERSRP